MTCKDCIHEKVCEALIKNGLPFDDGFPAESFCLQYKGKTTHRQVVICSKCKNLVSCCDGVHTNKCSLYGLKFKSHEIKTHYCSHGERI